MPSGAVVPGDVFDGCAARRRPGGPGPGLDEFAFERVEEGFGDSVVPALALAPGRQGDVQVAGQGGERGGGVLFKQAAIEDYRTMLLRRGASEAAAQGMVDMIEAQNRGIYDAEPRDPRSAAPTSFRQWCLDTLKPAIQACA
jgi:hypothetical protein